MFINYMYGQSKGKPKVCFALSLENCVSCSLTGLQVRKIYEGCVLDFDRILFSPRNGVMLFL